MTDPADVFYGADFAVGEVTGQRSFRVDDAGRLTGVAYNGYRWRPGENVAHCGYADKEGICGRVRCGCGFWAYHEGSVWQETPAYGVIRGYGKTTIGTKGFRCEKAEIVALCLKERRRLGRFGKWMADAGDKFFVLFFLGAAVAMAGIALPLLIVPGFGIMAVGMVGLFGTFIYNGRVDRLYEDAHVSLRPELADRVRKLYPDVKFYTSRKAMLKDFPVDSPPPPTPEEDPMFWEPEWKRRDTTTTLASALQHAQRGAPMSYYTSSPAVYKWSIKDAVEEAVESGQKDCDTEEDEEGAKDA